MRFLAVLGLAATLGCSAAGEQLDEGLTACVGEGCDQAQYRDERDIALRVRATHEHATTHGLDPYVGFFLDSTPVVEPIELAAVREWVCDRSEVADYLNAAGQTEEVGQARRDQTRALFGCEAFERVEVVFLIDPVRDPDLAVYYDDGDVLVGHINDVN